MIPRLAFWISILTMLLNPICRSEELIGGRRSLVLEGRAARLVVDLAGGSIAEFRLADLDLNPLQWATPPSGETKPRGFGHFLCLDRWGPASAAEGANGMPYHGEAATVEWQLTGSPVEKGDAIQAEMIARLPLAGLSVKRTLQFSRTHPVVLVHEEVRNENKLGRIYNMVQHPTIGPPFLDADTVVDSNGRKGFAQGGPMPFPEEPSFYWPQATDQDGRTVDIRRLTDNPNPNVVSYAIDEELGWVTAINRARGLLIGYVWPTKDYPWVSLWRDTQNGKPSARGLEFGSTGLHQPFPILVRKGTIFGRSLFDHLDAGEARTKTFAIFLARIPSDYAGVASLERGPSGLKLRERRASNAREITVELDASFGRAP